MILMKHPNYTILSNGIITGARGKPLKPNVYKNGYAFVSLCTNGKTTRYSVHRLIATMYCKVKRQDQIWVNHKDGNKLNNHSSNLEWCTPKENLLHAIANGLKRVDGENNPSSKLTSTQVLSIRKMNGILSSRKVGKQFNVNKATILAIWNRTKWATI